MNEETKKALELAREALAYRWLPSTHAKAIAAIDAALLVPAAPVAPDWKPLKQYGYAPGSYMNRCHQCNVVVSDVDKRAITCRSCAEKLHAEATTPAAPVAQDLTDGQILAAIRTIGLPRPMGLARDVGPYEVTEPTYYLQLLVRAIERAHGIGQGGA